MSRQGPGLTRRVDGPFMGMGDLPSAPERLQMVLTAFIPGRGWLTTRRGTIYGGRHPREPLITDDEELLVRDMTIELRGSIRAMQHRLRRP